MKGNGKIRGVTKAESSKHKKRRVSVQPDDSSDSDDPSGSLAGSQDNEDSESIDEGEQQVDFDFVDPEESDFHVIKAIVHRYLDGSDFHSSEFADTIIEKSQVSGCVRSGDECIGLAAVLPLECFANLKSVQQITAFWKQKVSKDCKAALKDALKDVHTCLLISERVLNAPPQLATPLMAGIQRDLAQCKQEDDEELRTYGGLKQFLVCAKAYEDTGVAAHQTGAVPVADRSSSKQAATAKSLGELVFIRPEDECMHKYAAWSCSWAVPQSGEYEKNSKNMRVLMMISASGLRKSIKDLAGLFDHDLCQHGLS